MAPSTNDFEGLEVEDAGRDVTLAAWVAAMRYHRRRLHGHMEHCKYLLDATYFVEGIADEFHLDRGRGKKLLERIEAELPLLNNLVGAFHEYRHYRSANAEQEMQRMVDLVMKGSRKDLPPEEEADVAEPVDVIDKDA